MSFLSPFFLLGLPLLAVPVIIHLLSRRQQKRISWGAMQFLVQAVTRKRRLWRLTDLLLLLLRTAAFLFFIFALARPLLPATWLGGAVPRDVILVLDRSMSMARQNDSASLFERQLQEANGLLDELKGGDGIRVLLAGESPEWLSSEPLPATAGALRQLRTQLNELKPTLGSADLVGCLREATDLEAPKDKSVRVIYVISDGQRVGWRMDERPLWSAVQTRLQQATIPTIVNVDLLAAGDAGNISVNSLEAPRAFAGVGQPLSFTATVQNHGTKPSAPTLLTWRVEDQSVGVATVPELAPGASTTLSVSHPFESVGAFEVTCQLEVTDALAADNVGHLQVQVFDRIPILVVDDPREQVETDTPFIRAALGATDDPRQRGWHSVFEPHTLAPDKLATSDLSAFRCVVLANIRAVPSNAVEKLESYVRNGGGVWWALGNHTERDFFNDRIYRGGLGLSPLKLTEPVGDPNSHETFISVRAASDAHPATALLADFQRLDLDRVRVYRRHQFDPLSGKDVSTLLQGPSGEPIALERKLGRGRVIVQGIPLGISWSTLPVCQVYVALLHEWLWYLSEPNLPKRNLAVGEALIQASARSVSTAQLQLPDARTVEVAANNFAGASQFRYLGTRWPGPYVLTVPDQEQTNAPAKFYVQRDARESDFAPLTDADRQQWASTKEIRLNRGLASSGYLSQVEVPKHPLEGWLLVILAAVLLGELAVAGWTTHQRQLRVKPITM